MKSSGTNEFWLLYRELPEAVRKATRRTYRVWRRDPQASSLRFKKVRDAYSVRIARTGYRAIAVEVPDGFLWIWIGPHDDYERLLNRNR